MTASRPGAPPGTIATLMIRVWVGDDEPRVRGRLTDVRAGGSVTDRAVTDPAPIRAAVARWPAEWR